MSPTGTGPDTSEAPSSVCDPRAALLGFVAHARQLLDSLNPNAVLARHAPQMWDACGEAIRLFSGTQTLLARRVADAGVFKDNGHRDTADYLAARSGTSRAAMANMLATSYRLPALPATETAVRTGHLSLDQANAVADGAHANPLKEQELLTIARERSLKELRDATILAKAEADPTPDHTHNRQHDERHLRSRTGADGRWLFSGSGTPTDRARFEAALAPLLEAAFRNARTHGRHEPREALAYDALQQMAKQAHDSRHNGDDTAPGTSGASDDDNGDDPEHGPGDDPEPRPTPSTPPQTTNPSDDDNSAPAGEPTPAPAAETRPARPARKSRPRRPNLSLLPLLRLELSALHRGQRLPGEASEIAGNGPITLTSARQLLTDSVLKLVLTHDDQVVTVAHIGRAPPRPRHLALLHTDITDLATQPIRAGHPTCTIPGVGSVAATAARDLLGQIHGIDILDQVVQRGVDVHLIHLGRQPTTAQKVALLWSQPACSVSGCPHTFTQIDHRTEWSKQNRTELINLDRLCPHHHRLKTHHNYQLISGTGDRAFVPPTDPRHPDQTSGPSQAPQVA